MTLKMASPYLPPNSTMYWVRKVVPKELRPLIGKRELKRSLGTRDPNEAKRLAAAAISEFESTIAQARAGLLMDTDTLQGLAGDYYRERREDWLREARREQWAWERFESALEGHGTIPDRADSPIAERALVEDWGRPRVGALLKRHKLLAPPEFVPKLSVELYKAESRAIQDAALDNDYLPVADPDYPALQTPQGGYGLTLLSLFHKYAKAKELPPKTVGDWSKKVDHFDRWLNGKPITEVTTRDIYEYGDELKRGKGLSGKPLTAKTVNDGYLSAISSTYEWACKRGHVRTNPAKDASVETPRKEIKKRKPYSKQQVVSLLTAARGQETLYKRWLPWLLAFTGARIAELLWAKHADIKQEEGIWFIQIRDGENGRTVKNDSSTRKVPIHSVLIEEGFMDYLASIPKDGYLFPGDWCDAYGNRTKAPANRLRDWVRTVVSPATDQSTLHSFRHWFIQQCRASGIDGDLRRQLVGHSNKNDHGGYGPAEPPTLSAALEQLPSPLAET